MFAAPAPRGEVAGESSSFGVRGLSVELPAIKLELPTIKFPSCVRFRRDAEMRVEESFAPFGTGVPAVYGQLVPGGNAFATPVTPVAPVQQSVALVPATAQGAPTCPTSQSAPAQQPQGGQGYGAPSQSYSQPPQPPCVDSDADVGAEDCFSVPQSARPEFDATREAAVPPPPAPPVDQTVSELQRLRQQLALQQQMMIELQKSMEQTQRGLSSALTTVPVATGGAEPRPLPVAEEAPPRKPAPRIRPVFFEEYNDGWESPRDVEPVVRPSWEE